MLLYLCIYKIYLFRLNDGTDGFLLLVVFPNDKDLLVNSHTLECLVDLNGWVLMLPQEIIFSDFTCADSRYLMCAHLLWRISEINEERKKKKNEKENKLCDKNIN